MLFTMKMAFTSGKGRPIMQKLKNFDEKFMHAIYIYMCLK
jgi:hypothetical protein